MVFLEKELVKGTLKNRVPEAHTDYIVSVISEEFGVVVIILLLSSIFIFNLHMFLKKYIQKNNEKIKLILSRINNTYNVAQALMIHVGVNIRLFPTTGMTLPFLSYGGSSIIGVSILSGIILNLTKRKVTLI